MRLNRAARHVFVDGRSLPAATARTTGELAEYYALL
jgi:hypothetical protein